MIVQRKVVLPALVGGNVIDDTGDCGVAIVTPALFAPMIVHCPVSPLPAAFAAREIVPGHPAMSTPAVAIDIGLTL